MVYRLPSPLANRFVHIEMEVSADDWRMWAIGCGIDPRVVAYIAFKNSALFGFDPLKNERSFPTPRSWEAVHTILKSALPKKLWLEAISGAVGSDAAVDFLGFVQVMDKLPDIEAILQGQSSEVSEDLSTLYALSSALVSRLLLAPSDEAVSNVLRYSLHLKNEFAVMIVQDLQRQGVAMEHLDAFGEWVEAYAYLL